MGVYSTDTLHLLLGFDGISWVCKSTKACQGEASWWHDRSLDLQSLHVNTLEATEETAPAAGPCHSGACFARSTCPEDSGYSASFILTFALL